MEEEQLIELATQIRAEILKGRSVDLKCWVVTLPLSLRLSEMGIENKIIKVEVDALRCKASHEFDVLEHFCIKVGRKILDATASQFESMPEVYFGSRPVWYKDPTE